MLSIHCACIFVFVIVSGYLNSVHMLNALSQNYHSALILLIYFLLGVIHNGAQDSRLTLRSGVTLGNEREHVELGYEPGSIYMIRTLIPALSFRPKMVSV